MSLAELRGRFMSEARPKRTALDVLRFFPRFSGIAGLPSLQTQAGRNFLRWLDQSGLALPFFDRLQQLEGAGQLSAEWQVALQERLARNIARTQDMFAEFQRLGAAFRSCGVAVAALKGFTLAPDFCEHAHLRHQVDFDFLVHPSRARAAAEALQSCGYSTDCLNESGETCFRTPLQHIPSASDDLYALQHQRQVDLHISIWEPCSWLPLEVPDDSLENVQVQNILGAEVPALPLEDKFLLQVLHAFRHSFRSWVRVSWLLEIARCVELHRDDTALWSRVMKRAGSAPQMKRIFIFVLGLAERLFHCSTPPPVRSWMARASTPSLAAWLDHFSVNWAIADWPGSLENIFLAAEFIPNANLRRQYWRSRLFPKKASTSLGVRSSATQKQWLQWQAARLEYVSHRTAMHMKELMALPFQQMRWRRAVQTSRRLGFDGNC
jgi:hypothetical protein